MKDEINKITPLYKKRSMILLAFLALLIIAILTLKSGQTIPKSEDYTAEELANMSPEELEKLVPNEILKRFSAEELANMTSDELKHIVPTKFKKRGKEPEKMMQVKPLKVLPPEEEDITARDILPASVFEEEVPFKVGQEIRYESMETKNGERYASRSNMYMIGRIEEIDNRTVYVVHLNWNATIYEPSEYFIKGEDVIYQEINTGKIVKVILNAGGPSNSQSVFFGKEAERQLIETSRLLFAPWMLNLSDNFTYNGLYDARVIGKERINGEDSFKVEIISRDRLVYMWVSIKRAELLKEELYIRDRDIIAVRELISNPINNS